MQLNFTKMHSLGNDFVLLDGVNQKIQLSKEQIQKIAHRQLGIGCDQIIILEAPRSENIDFYYRIYNTDGSEAEQCGNGIRCAAQFFSSMQTQKKETFTAECLGGQVTLKIIDQNIVTAYLDPPNFDPEQIPFLTAEKKVLYEFSIRQETHHISVLSLGNPHAVLVVQDITTYPVEKIGENISKNPAFPKETNVEFVQIVNRHHILLRVYERGVGETYACGSGACSAVIAGIQQGLLDQKVTVEFRFGTLEIEWQGQKIAMTGPTTTVFTGMIQI